MSAPERVGDRADARRRAARADARLARLARLRDDRGRQRLRGLRRRGERRAAGGRGRRLEHNVGYTRAINLGVRRARGERIVLLNDDCVCDPGFVEAITAPIDPAAGVVMAAGVMRDWRDRSLIDSAGMELDRTLLVFDYLNGEPVSRLDAGVADPIGPSAAAAAFDRDDLPLRRRLRRAAVRLLGGRRPGPAPAPARVPLRARPDARGDHEHSATLGSGSARKNYLMGFGRGYVLRKWGVLTPRRLPAVLARELALCAGQAVLDRNLAGIRGRVQGYRAATDPSALPGRARARARVGGDRDAAPPRRAAQAPAERRRPRPAGCARWPSFTSPTPAGRRARSRPSSPGSPARERSTSSSPGPATWGRCSATGRG